MASKPISAMTQFTPLGRMLMPVVDPAAATGNKNGSVLLGALISMLGANLATLQADFDDGKFGFSGRDHQRGAGADFAEQFLERGRQHGRDGRARGIGHERRRGRGQLHGRHRDVVGSVSPGGTPVQVAIGPSNTVAPTSGWTAATVNGTGFTASITEATAGTYYIWAQQAENAAVQVVSAAVTVTAPP